MQGSGWQDAVTRAGEAMVKRQGPPPLSAEEKAKIAEISQRFGYENPRAFFRDLRHDELKERETEINQAFKDAGLRVPTKRGAHGKQRARGQEGQNLIQKLLGGLDPEAVKKLQELAETSDNPSLKALVQALLTLMFGVGTTVAHAGDSLGTSKASNGSAVSISA